MKIYMEETQKLREVYHKEVEILKQVLDDLKKYNCSKEILEYIKSSEYIHVIEIYNGNLTITCDDSIAIHYYNKDFIWYYTCKHFEFREDESPNEDFRTENVEEFDKYIDKLVVLDPDDYEYDSLNVDILRKNEYIPMSLI